MIPLTNYAFTTIPLIIKLKALGITTLGTIWLNRLQNCPLETDKNLKKSGCGSSSYRYLLFLFLENFKISDDIYCHKKIMHFLSNFQVVVILLNITGLITNQFTSQQIGGQQIFPSKFNAGMGKLRSMLWLIAQIL